MSYIVKCSDQGLAHGECYRSVSYYISITITSMITAIIISTLTELRGLPSKHCDLSPCVCLLMPLLHQVNSSSPVKLDSDAAPSGNTALTSSSWKPCFSQRSVLPEQSYLPYCIVILLFFPGPYPFPYQQWLILLSLQPQDLICAWHTVHS